MRGDRAADTEPRGPVLVGVKSGSDSPATRFAFEDAERRDARVLALHAWRFPQLSYSLRVPPTSELRHDPETLRKAADSIPRYAVADCRDDFPKVAVHTDHECRDTASVLVDASANADVIVLGVRRRPRGHGLPLGPATHAVLHHAPCPVVLVPLD